MARVGPSSQRAVPYQLGIYPLRRRALSGESMLLTPAWALLHSEIRPRMNRVDDCMNPMLRVRRVQRFQILSRNLSWPSLHKGDNVEGFKKFE